MQDKKILVLGTAARGGIRSVIEAYETAGFYGAGRAHFIPTHIEGALFARLITALSAYLIVAKYLLSRRVALLHIHMSMRGSFWRKLIFQTMARLFRVPTIVHLHGSEFAVFYRNSSPWTQKAIRWLFDNADGVVVLSESWRDFLKSLTHNDIQVIGNFVPDRYAPEQGARMRNLRHLLFMGQFGTRKGIYDLLSVYANVAKRFPGTRLYCGGNGEVDKVRAIVRDMKAEDVISVPGWVSGEEKESLLHQCGIFVLPSYNEGLPMAIIEAMSYGMPIISTNVGGIPELVSPSNGVIIPPGDKNALGDALVAMLRREDTELAAMGKVSRNLYEERYSPKACLNGMQALYARIGVTP